MCSDMSNCDYRPPGNALLGLTGYIFIKTLYWIFCMHIFTYCISFLRFQENTEETLGLSFHYLNLRGFICRKWHLLLRRMSVRSWGAGMVSYFSCVWLCDPMDCNLPGSSVHGILQARLLEWVAISFSRGSSQPRDWTCVSCISGRRFTIWATREAPVFGNSGL